MKKLLIDTSDTIIQLNLCDSHPSKVFNAASGVLLLSKLLSVNGR